MRQTLDYIEFHCSTPFLFRSRPRCRLSSDPVFSRVRQDIFQPRLIAPLPSTLNGVAACVVSTEPTRIASLGSSLVHKLGKNVLIMSCFFARPTSTSPAKSFERHKKGAAQTLCLPRPHLNRQFLAGACGVLLVRAYNAFIHAPIR